MFTKETAQMTVTKSGSANWDAARQEASSTRACSSLPFANVLPDSPKTVDFVRTVWPTNMQRALLGQITPADMMQAIEKHYHG